jgi:DNA polymerase II small subunit/DNA polymerase delta subunit B
MATHFSPNGPAAFPHLSEQQEAVLEILEDGRWHAANEFYSSFLPNFRSRMSELRKLFPGRFESRFRSGATGKDWRDTAKDADLLAEIQLRHSEKLEQLSFDVHPDTISAAVKAEFEGRTDPFRA